MQTSSHIKWFRLFPALLVLLFTGCSPETVCTGEAKITRGEIVSISGQGNIKKGEEVILTIGIRNDPAICSKEVIAHMENKGLDTLILNGEISYTTGQAKEDCGCKKEEILYTLLYFTPLSEGSYHFIVPGKDTMESIGSGGQIGFVINVE